MNQCKTIVTFDNTPESKILDASNILYFLIYKSLGLLHAKTILEYLKLNILHIVYLTDRSYVNVH